MKEAISVPREVFKLIQLPWKERKKYYECNSGPSLLICCSTDQTSETLLKSFQSDMPCLQFYLKFWPLN